MIHFVNPYTPGAGRMPGYLAGREDTIKGAKEYMLSTKAGYPQRSIVYYGLRGVGKTVLLNAIEECAEDNDVMYAHIEVKEVSNLIQAISVSSKKFILSISPKEAALDRKDKLIAIFKSFSATWNPGDQTISFGLSGEGAIGAAGTGDLANDLMELLVALGKYAKQSETSICFFVDEIQYARDVELEALITAIHRINQLGLPIVFYCAGLPKILKTMGEVKSYSERLFNFVQIDSLNREDAEKAIVKPAEEFKVTYKPEALQLILETTSGYPYFIQELCNKVWESYNDCVITREAVESAISISNESLDKSFFMVRFDRCTAKEKEFMIAMVKCGDLPCTISNVAMNMNKNVTSISLLRAQLINKGLIYATGHAEIDFTVPQFDQFIRRVTPESFERTCIVQRAISDWKQI